MPRLSTVNPTASKTRRGCAVTFRSAVRPCTDSDNSKAVTAGARGVTFPPLTFWIYHPMSISFDP